MVQLAAACGAAVLAATGREGERGAEAIQVLLARCLEVESGVKRTRISSVKERVR